MSGNTRVQDIVYILNYYEELKNIYKIGSYNIFHKKLEVFLWHADWDFRNISNSMCILDMLEEDFNNT